MSGTDESVFVRHMLDAVARVERYVSGVEREAFLADEILQDAVVRQLEILGEAAGRISRPVCARHPEIPWPKVTGLRHRLIHYYFGVDFKLVWKVATAEIAELKPKLQALLRDIDQGS